MRTYDILADFGLKDEDADQISLNAGCVIAIFRHKYPVTYSRSNQASFSDFATRAVEMFERPLIIVDDIASVQVSATKGSHVTALNGNLRPGINYLAEAMPGDYVFCWMVQNKETLNSLIGRLEKGEACNEFNDGLKFFGKLTAMRKRGSIAAGGNKSATFVFNAAGFTEFDGSIYFEPNLQLNSIGLISDWMQNFGVSLNKIIAENGDGIGVNEMMPTLLQVFFGSGVPQNRGMDDQRLKLTAGLDNPFSFIVPTCVGKIFGVKTGTKPHGLLAFTDILEVIHGIQSYAGDLSVDSTNNKNSDIDANNGTVTSVSGKVFQPKNTEYSFGGSKIRFTQTRQMGTFMPSVPATTGQVTAWGMINQFLNPTINEVYTALRTDGKGKIYPTFICRQLPLSSGLLSDTFIPKPIPTVKGPNGKSDTEISDSWGLDMSDKSLSIEVGTIERIPDTLGPPPKSRSSKLEIKQTLFLDLPRWRIHPIFVKGFDIGRSDALRHNFVHVVGESGAKDGINRTGAFAQNQPFRDDLDIARSGLRPLMVTVPCAPSDEIDKNPSAWMYLMSDFLMGQHLTLTGSLDCHGIQQPIVVGDNIEFDDTVLHIEGVTHSFQADSNGNKRFGTVLNLTHGMNAKQANGDDTALYTGINSGELTAMDARVTRDSENELPQPIQRADRSNVLDSGDVSIDLESVSINGKTQR